MSAWDAGLRDILLVDKNDRLGGVLPQCIHEGFGLSLFNKELTGPEFARYLTGKLDNSGVKIKLNTTAVSLSDSRTAILSGNGVFEKVGFEKLILATGCREISIGSLLIPGTRPAGIYTAGQAQEMINLHRQDIGNNILILGSGDLGMIMARRFMLERKKVIAVIEKEAHFGGMARNFHRCIEKYNIPVLYKTEVTEILGSPRIEGVKTTGGTISCDTLVTAVGMIPERALLNGLGTSERIKLCGNCNKIHDLVDSAVEEAIRTGKNILKG